MTMMFQDAKFCEIVAKDRKDPLNNSFEALSDQDEWPKSWSKKKLYYYVFTETNDLDKAIYQTQAVNLMMTMWDIEIDLDLHPTTDPDKADIKIYWKSSAMEPYFKERPATLAFAYYPGQGEASGVMVFNDDYYWNMTGKGVNAHKVDPLNYPDPETTVMLKGYNIIAVGGHEAGHMLGLSHSTRGMGLDLMDPYYNPNMILPSMYDVLRLLARYPREVYRFWRHLGWLRKWMRIRILRYHIH